MYTGLFAFCFVMILIRSDKIAFFTCLTVTFGMLISGFIVPPTGVIDPSVLTGCGIIAVYPTLAVGALAIKDGKHAVLKRGNVELEVNCLADDQQNSIQK